MHKIKVHIELFGGLKTDKPKILDLSLKDGTTIREVLVDEYRFKEEHLNYFVFLVNEKEVKLDYILKEDDNLKVLLPMGGGRVY